MSALRAPTVGGLAGGVGTSTVARALRGRDLGPVGGHGRLPDVVVCRATVSGLDRAARVAPPSPGPDRPVLAVTPDGPVPDDGPVAERLEKASGWSAVVLLPRIDGWALVADPLAEASALLARPVDDLPGPLRDYAAALTRIAQAVADGGRLVLPDGEPDGGTGVLRPVRGIWLGPPTGPAPVAPPGSAW